MPVRNVVTTVSCLCMCHACCSRSVNGHEIILFLFNTIAFRLFDISYQLHGGDFEGRRCSAFFFRTGRIGESRSGHAE